jgi:transglutaminase-like putative cysteine protease
MSIKEQLTIAAGIAVALASTALFPVFQNGSWYFEILGAVFFVVVTGLVTRRLGLPRLLQPVAALVVVVTYLVVDFASASLSHGILPTGATFDALRTLAEAGQDDISNYGPPVPMTRGLLLLTVGGVALVAVLVDLIAVVLDRAAVSGLALLLLLAIPSAVLPDGISGQFFGLGAIGWLGLLLVEGSERVGRWGTPMRSALPGAKPGGDDSSLGRVGRRIGFSAVVLAIAIPYATPGLDHRLLGGNGDGPGDGNSDQPHSAKTFNPITKLSEQLNKSTPVELFQYKTTDKNPDYIRMTTLDKYNDGQWEASQLVADAKNDRLKDGIDTPVGEGGPHDDFSMSLVIVKDHLDVHWLPLPFGPTRVSNIEKSWLWEDDSQTGFSAQRNTKNLKAYRVTASRVVPQKEALEAASVSDLADSVDRIYNRPVQVAPYVKSLVLDTITKDKTTEYAEAVAIQDFFSPKNGFVYDTVNVSVPRSGSNQDELEAFLRGKSGFCEQYATAMAAMLRVAGIPSRVAVGFTPGTKLLQSEGEDPQYSVTTKDAHAWPEAWFAGTGWVRFEPTPPASGSSVPSYAQATAPIKTGPDNPADPTTATPTPTTTAAPGGRLPLEEPDAEPTATVAKTESGLSLWLLAPVVAAVLLVLPFLLTLVRRRRRLLHPGALTAWDQLVDDATDVGYVWHHADSPRAAAARLLAAQELPAPAVDALQRIASAAEQVRYAPPGREVGGDLTPDNAAVRAGLQSLASRTVRLRALLFPPSTLRWVSEGIGERLSQVLNAFDDALSALTRPIRRRASNV